MSANLANSARLAKDPDFIALVRAALVERALATTDALSKTVLGDAEWKAPAFACVAADDAVISAAGWQPNDKDVRRVVASAWSVISAKGA